MLQNKELEESDIFDGGSEKAFLKNFKPERSDISRKPCGDSIEKSNFKCL